MSSGEMGVLPAVSVVQGSMTGQTPVPPNHRFKLPIHHVRGMISAVVVASVAALGAIVVSPPAAAQTCAPSWTPTFGDAPGIEGGANEFVGAMTVFDDGTGPALYVGGQILTAGGVSTKSIAKWDGSKWSPLGSGIQTNHPNSGGVRALVGFNDGSGLALYAGGRFSTVVGGATVNDIAKWDGASWSPVGGGIFGNAGAFNNVNALTVFDDGTGPALYVGGTFTIAGGVPVNNIAKWDGSAWAPVGGGLNGNVNALTVFDDGTGPALYVVGFFTTAGGVPANHIAKWDGSSWAPVGGGLNGSAGALTIFDDGTGAALYASGSFTTAGGVPANHIAKWNGSAWTSLGSGVTAGFGHNGIVGMAVFDDGTGPALFFSGDFTVIGGVSVTNIAKWDGASWSPLGSGLHNGASFAVQI